MRRLGLCFAAGFVCVLLTILMCSAPDPVALSVTAFDGDVVLERNNSKVALSNGLKLKPADRITVGAGQSRLELQFVNGARLKCYVGTELIIGEKSSGSKNITVVSGECFYLNDDTVQSKEKVAIKISTLQMDVSDAIFSIYYNSETAEIISTVLSGSVKINDGNKTMEVPSCTRISKVGGEELQMQAPSASELEGLKVWAGCSIIEKTLAKTGCTLQALSSVSMPPQIISTPGEVAHPGERYDERIVAQDPEGFAVHYFLADGPDSMSIDMTTGKIRYKPAAECEKIVRINIIDRDSNITKYEYTLSVTIKPSLYISMPSAAKPGEPVSITAKVKRSSSDKGIIDYRFDINGDGSFDIPAGGGFGKKSSVSNIIFPKDGIHLIKVEARISSDLIITANKKIIVNSAPSAVLKISPEYIRIDQSVIIDASGSSDPNENASDLKMRFDIDGDGIWDIPSDSKFTKEQVLSFRFDSPGKKMVNVQVCDKLGACSIASAEILIGKGLIVKKIDCVDTAHVGDTISVSCIADNPEFPVIGYAWSVKGPQSVTVSDNKPRVNMAFAKEGVYTLSCAITDEKTQSATDSRQIVIVNSRASVDAGGPYKIAVNVPLTVKGSASDKDNRIVKYSWDFNNDGKADTESVSGTSAVWIFKNEGQKTVIFSVYTEDGNVSTDEALVEVTNTAPVAKAGKNIISRAGRKVKLKGTAVDSEKNICEYAWDFDHDGVYDWRSADTGYVEHEFEAYAVAIFRVTDCDSAYSIDSVKIVVCPEGMETVENGQFCIDTYEWPNKKNTFPKLDVSYEEALQMCSEAGKRLCTAREWETACRSDEKKWKYPYGKNYVVDKCNNMGNAFSKNKPAESGYFQECVGSGGVFDMSGNAAEWVYSDGGKPEVYGGSWQNGAEQSMCNSKVQLERGKKYFYAGFRCCK
ncbi:MAG TPA: PKD domain-containing protein [Chitinispirillaceae bacterium]|nr:PKD domain-containing protein [Chitinispirillaceae bacterium]